MRIIWSKKANYTFYTIQNYLEYFWSPLIAQKFIKDVLHILNLLESNTMLGKYNSNLKCREILISKHITLYYQTEKDHLELISFYNNRQKPINIIDL
ncbi:type II toxin-antitoxin system RelE/ParE family toxin [Flavobacterium sp. 245]|uniref:type II toxin-antitoxin system RelE/ParE family toxin n=1 Tax=Flavobacterium sp. 245 TaxID=2512115 RepID=UPI00105F83CC|nr:type II toxin-antitoxin system RelE/ParE family toxin [Flavobacterium sp. 245]TDP03985.1 plasmid stabilization system protein ParE [Flavobacterium sp. 245]